MNGNSKVINQIRGESLEGSRDRVVGRRCLHDCPAHRPMTPGLEGHTPSKV